MTKRKHLNALPVLFGLLFLLYNTAAAENKVVVIPLGGTQR